LGGNLGSVRRKGSNPGGGLERTFSARVIASQQSWDIAACYAQIGEFTVGHSIEFTAGFAEFLGFFAKEEHFHLPSSFF
jgi:hypothetical protein